MNLSVADRRQALAAIHGAVNGFSELVLPKVAAERQGRPPAQDKARKLAQGKIQDNRPVRLMAISGKGGHHSDPTRAAVFAHSANVSLLDHLASVGRGASVLASLRLAHEALARGDEVDVDRLEPAAALAMAIGFMHDVNKSLDDGQGSLADVSVQQFEEAGHRYGIFQYLAEMGWEAARQPSVLAPLLLDLVRGSEVNQSTEDVWDAARDLASTSDFSVEAIDAIRLCVRYADRLDGKWLRGGAPALVEEIQALDLPGQGLGEWETIRLCDAHLPFVLDRLLLAVESLCTEEAGLPPLINTHMDGQLVCMVPRQIHPGFLERAIDRMIQDLPFRMEIKLNPKKGMDIIGARPHWDVLVKHLAGLAHAPESSKQAYDLVFVHKRFGTAQLFDDMRHAWAQAGAGHLVGAPDAEPSPGKYSPLVSHARFQELLEQVRAGVPAAQEDWRLLSRAMALAVALQVVGQKKSKAPGPAAPAQRWETLAALLESLGAPLPSSLRQKAPDVFTASISLALWAAATAKAIGPQELEYVWALGREIMDGAPDQGARLSASHEAGLASTFPEPWQQRAVQELKQRLLVLGGQMPVQIGPEEGVGGPRCLFTDAPLPIDEVPMGMEYGLYGVKMSAFSGRAGRPDHLMAAPASPRNFISPCLRLEHAIRQMDFQSVRGKPGGVALTVSTPLRSGLFAGVRACGISLEQQERAPVDVATYDLLREAMGDKPTVSGQNLVVEQALPSRGYRLSRYESLPSRLEDRIDFYLRWIKAARRFGRPVHVFRGLPRPTKAFVYFQGLPPVLWRLLGFDEWRLEQLPQVQDRLELAAWLVSKAAGGPGEVWLARLLDPDMGWAAAGWLLTRDMDASTNDGHRLPDHLKQLVQEIAMSTTETTGVFRQMAAENAAFQRFSGAFWRLSNNERAMAWNTALDLWSRHQAGGLSDLVDARDFLAGGLREAMERKGALLGGKQASQALDRFVDLFLQVAPRLSRAPDLRQSMTGAYVNLLRAALDARFEQIRKQPAIAHDPDTTPPVA